jgi:type VI secretion system protein ImpL
VDPEARVFSFINFRTLVRLIAFALIALFIWYAGPYFAFGSYHPLEPETSRYIAIALVFVLWLLLAVMRWLRAKGASDKLVAAISQVRPEKERPSAEAVKLRERFEEAVAALKQRGGRSLYELPWYVFIGAPGSGKTTALVNSGLRFPLEQRVGKGAVRGVGGTRNCDWWFTEEAVFLDTAGRYMTQDSDQTSDSEGWREFLSLLRTYRVRRPLNGVILTISCQDLLTQTDHEREAHVEAAQHRLHELTGELKVQLPVYVMVTKCDMVPGFTDYFDDLNQDGRAQVWGVTFPYEQTVSGDAPNAFTGEFDALMGRLNDRVFARVEEERGGRRRASVFAFPQQMATLRDLLAEFVSDVCSASRADRQILLRGVYLTSGTQDGTQIDRLLGAIGRRFGVAADAVAPPPGKGKAFFVERLLKDVMIGESGLAGVNRRLELQKAAWQVAAYAGTVFVVVVGMIVLWVSYSNNRTYLDEVSNDVATLRRVRLPASRASLEAFLPYLNAVRAVSDSANRYRDSAPWSMRWGLYQGGVIGNAARDAYLRELDSIVLPRFAARVRQHLIDYASEPEKMYVYLKAYLMLGEPKRLDKKHLQFVADLEWPPPVSGSTSGALPSTHFRNLLEYSGTLRPIAIEPALVAQARNAIRQASIPQIIYGQMQRNFAADTANALHLDVTTMGIDKVLRRRSGRKLSEPVPAIYTQKVFKDVTGPGILPFVKQFAEEEWVWGTGGVAGAAGLTRLGSQVSDIYERDYANWWSGFLNDLAIVPFTSVQQYADGLGILTSPTSPLKGVLKIAVENTSLVGTAPDPSKQAIGTRIAEGARDLFNQAQQKLAGTGPAGTVVTQRFEPIQRLMAGAPSPFDGVLDQVRKIREQVSRVATELGGTAPLTAIKDPAVHDLWRSVDQDASNLPQPVDRLVKEIVNHAEIVITGAAKSELDTKYAGVVIPRCRLLVEGRYPFSNGPDVQLTEFGDVFGPGGLYDKFFTENVEQFVDTLGSQWTWKSSPLSSSPDLLPQFQRAERIRRMFFPAGAKTPELNFTLTLSSLDKAATRFFLEINGQRYDVKPGAAGGSPAVWPGMDKKGYVYAAFEDNVAAPDRINQTQGPWALFHVVDATRVAPSGQGPSEGDLSSVLLFKSKYHQAQVTIEAPNAASNPFAAADWRQFTCGR